MSTETTADGTLFARLQEMERAFTERLAALEMALAAKDTLHETRQLQVVQSAAVGQNIDVGHDLAVDGNIDAAALRIAKSAVVGDKLDVGGDLVVKGAIDATAIKQGKVPINLSQWTTGANGISYDKGNVGIGTSTPGAKLDVRGDINAGNSDIYFTRTDHRWTAKGEAAGHAAIENAVDYGALMILGRAGTPQGRAVKLWDYLQINGTLDVTGRINGQLGTLDVAPSHGAHIRCADLHIGGVGDRGPARRALVAWPDMLVINHGYDWKETWVHGFREVSTRENKNDIEPMELVDARDRLQSLAPVEYSIRADGDGRRQCGFIAEETPEILASRGQKAISLAGILAVLTKVVQAQEQELAALRAQVTDLLGPAVEPAR